MLVFNSLRHFLIPNLCFSVTMGFFDDILIPPESLQQPAKLYPDFPNEEVHVASWRAECVSLE